MNLYKVSSIIVGSVLFVCIAHAQNDTIVQAGSVTCNLDLKPYACPYVQFKTEFGVSPSLATSFTQMQGLVTYSLIAITTPDLTTKGFTPTIRVNTIPSPPPSSPGADLRHQPKLIPSTLRVSRGYWAPQGGQISVSPGGMWVISWVAVGPPPPVKVTAIAKYIVLSVVYAPPGTNGGASRSSVSYASGSQYGTTASAGHTFKQNYSVEVAAGAGVFGNGGQGGLSFAYGRSNTDTQSLEIKNSSTSTLTQNGPPQDGISHDRDRIYLLLNPTIELAVTASSITWSLQPAASPHILYVYVGNLNGHIPWESSVKATLDSEHLTEDDYAVILQRDPLANIATNVDPSTVDPKRYKLVTTIGYEPPLTPGDTVPVQSYALSSSLATTAGSTIQDSYQVGLTMKSDVSLIATGSLKVSSTWEWTNSSSTSTSSGTSESATASIGGPASGYSGSNYVAVYYDNVFRTFAFSMMPRQAPAVQGTLVNSSGTPLPATGVSLLANGVTYHTFTDSKGRYMFFCLFYGVIELNARGLQAKHLMSADLANAVSITVFSTKLNRFARRSPSCLTI
jgi:hypothetical protein